MTCMTLLYNVMTLYDNVIVKPNFSTVDFPAGSKRGYAPPRLCTIMAECVVLIVLWHSLFTVWYAFHLGLVVRKHVAVAARHHLQRRAPP